VGSVFARESEPFFSMTHLLSPGSCTRWLSVPLRNRPVVRRWRSDPPVHPPSPRACRRLPNRLLYIVYARSKGRPTAGPRNIRRHIC